MKLYYIANARIPTEKAHGVQIMKMCEAFVDAGHEVKLIVPKRKNPIQEDPFAYYSVKRNFTIKKLWCLDTVRFGFFGFLLEWLLFSETVFWYSFFGKQDIYFGRDYISLLYLAFFGRKTVWEAHTGEWNWFVWLFSKFGARIVVISDGLKNFYISKGVSEEKIIVTRDAVDPQQFAVRIGKDEAKKNLGIKTDLPIVMYIGALGGWKGVDTLLAAAKLLKDKVQFVIIGGEEKQIKPLRAAYPEVLFLGFRPYRELSSHQQAADVLVVPNTAKDAVSAKYTSPLKVFAHMTSGIPIIASDLPSIREVLNESNAYFAKPDNPQSFAEVIKTVIENKAVAKQKAEQASRDIELYTWKKRAEIITHF
ncbi:MAG TPA: glycosyltransferase family 4 protein [Candidatus Paceibacterota bacterium]